MHVNTCFLYCFPLEDFLTIGMINLPKIHLSPLKSAYSQRDSSWIEYGDENRDMMTVERAHGLSIHTETNFVTFQISKLFFLS